MTPERFNWPGAVCPLAPTPEGDFVRFTDVEPALRCTVRLAWLMPMLDGTNDPAEGDRIEARFAALDAAHAEGLRGTALVDKAMAACPA